MKNMEVELERTFLLRKLPKDIKGCKSAEILDVYFPTTMPHPILRLRKKGNRLVLTKKAPIKNDSSRQGEQTITLSKEEFLELSSLPGKRVRKIRYYYSIDGYLAEIDIFLDDLKGLVLVDFEFSSIKEKERFSMPDFCLVDVTQEDSIAGGFLAGRKYSDIESFLKKYNYQKLQTEI